MATGQVRFGATVIDELGTEASTNAYVLADTSQTIAQAATAAGAWAAALDGVIGGQITGIRVSIPVTLPGGIKATPAAGSRVEQTGVVNLRAGTTPRRWGIALPSLSDAMIVAGKLNLADTAVTTLTGLLQGAVLSGTYITPYGNALGAIVDAVLSFRKRRKQLARTSFEV